MSRLVLGFGLAISLALSRIAAALDGVSPTDPVTFARIAVVLIAPAIAAVISPVARAARLDPMIALRHE